MDNMMRSDSERNALLSTTRKGLNTGRTDNNLEITPTYLYGLMRHDVSLGESESDQGTTDSPASYEEFVQPNVNVNRSVTCRICQGSIDTSEIDGRCVVKCSRCGEATPIQSAPPGKKYVRCPCNCLLVCKSSSQRIACPRPKCKRVINLNMISPTIQSVTCIGKNRVICAHCEGVFMFDVMKNALVKCPHCHNISSVGHRFAMTRGGIFLLFTILLLIIALVIYLYTDGNLFQHIFLGCFLIGFLIAAVYTFSKCFYYFRVKVSEIEKTMGE